MHPRQTGIGPGASLAQSDAEHRCALPLCYHKAPPRQTAVRIAAAIEEGERTATEAVGLWSVDVSGEDGDDGRVRSADRLEEPGGGLARHVARVGAVWVAALQRPPFGALRGVHAMMGDSVTSK